MLKKIFGEQIFLNNSQITSLPVYVNCIATISPVFWLIDLFIIPFQFNTLVLTDPLKDNIVNSVYLPYQIIILNVRKC